MTSLGSKSYSALVVIGSSNEERQFGIDSGLRVAQALRTRGWNISVCDILRKSDLLRQIGSSRFDLIVPVGFGLSSPEDGTIFTIAKLFGVPCAGPTPLCGNICTDKSIFQAVVRGISPCNELVGGQLRVRTPQTFVASRSTTQDAIQIGIRSLPLPILLKPAYGGS